MSVPKRFKTKVQVVTSNVSARVSLKGSSYQLIDKNLIFSHTIKQKKVCSHKVNYLVKLQRSSIVAIPQPSKLPTSVRFGPTLVQVSKNNVPLLIPMFNYIIFLTPLNFLCQHTIKPGYKLITTLSSIYSKFSPVHFLKLNKFILKTFSAH